MKGENTVGKRVGAVPGLGLHESVISCRMVWPCQTNTYIEPPCCVHSSATKHDIRHVRSVMLLRTRKRQSAGLLRQEMSDKVAHILTDAFPSTSDQAFL